MAGASSLPVAHLPVLADTLPLYIEQAVIDRCARAALCRVQLFDTRRIAIQIVIATFIGSPLLAQTADSSFPVTATSRSAPRPAAVINSTPPPLSAPMRQKTWDTISNRDTSQLGNQLLGLNPRNWYHGETENFILHYRNFSDALQIAREIESDLWYVAKTLGATKDQYARKSHVYVLQDDKEWQRFVKDVPHVSAWSHSFAVRDELFLNVHGTGTGFESHTLAHEMTHAVVARIYGDARWPLWLNEGFADYMGDACLAVRRGLQPGANPRNLPNATLTVTELTAISQYPDDPASVSRLYDTGTKFVRYLFSKYPPDLFPKFVNRLLAGSSAPEALPEIYGAEFRDLPAFDKRFMSSIR